MKHQLGLTLLEVSIALSIGMAILLMATKSMGYLNRYNATHEVKSEVALLRLALKDYYHYECRQQPFTRPTVARLKAGQYLPAQFNADNSIGSNYTFTINNNVKPPSYTINLVLNEGLANNVYAPSVGATHQDRIYGTRDRLRWIEPILPVKINRSDSVLRFQQTFGPRCP